MIMVRKKEKNKTKTYFQIYFLLFNWLVLRTWGVLGRCFYKVLARKNNDGGRSENLDGQSVIEGHLMEQVLLLNLIINWRGGGGGKLPPILPPAPLRFRRSWEKIIDLMTPGQSFLILHPMSLSLCISFFYHATTCVHAACFPN